MSNLNESVVYRTATTACIISAGRPLEVEEAKRDRLGGPASLPPVANPPAPTQGNAMKQTAINCYLEALEKYAEAPVRM